MAADGCPLLILGATGLLGQALRHEAARRRLPALAVARGLPPGEVRGVALDLTDEAALRALLAHVQPELVINAAANTRLPDCEQRPAESALVNTRLPGLLAHWCARHGARLVQVSTDHFFTGTANALHDEAAPVTLVNEYARQKYAAEALALTAPGALVLRTNIVGFRGWAGQPSFVEWAVGALEGDAPFTAFTDMWTSSLDVASFARALFDLVDRGASGLLNLAAREASSKYDFIRALAAALHLPTGHLRAGSVMAQGGTPRANALGLAVDRAEALLGRRLPGLDEVIGALARRHQEESPHVA